MTDVGAFNSAAAPKTCVLLLVEVLALVSHRHVAVSSTHLSVTHVRNGPILETHRSFGIAVMRRWECLT